MSLITSKNVPKRIFIVPYRDRPQQKFFFSTYMTSILEQDQQGHIKEDANNNDYEIYFSHQCDKRTFNRGATKNIGFLAMKKKYPDDYKKITFIFNDLDTVPFANILNYDTTPGIVKHFYGFKFTLGGIVSILGEDFEKVNGFPNFWGWGMEDNVLQDRCKKHGLTIDRSNFFPLGSPEILHIFDGINRIINKRDPIRAKNDSGIDGVSSINSLSYTIDLQSSNNNDNIHAIKNDNLFYINITGFLTFINFEKDEYYNYDLREPAKTHFNPLNEKKTDNFTSNTTEWSNIPYYPNSQERKQLVQKYIETQKSKQLGINPALQRNLNSSQNFSATNLYAADYAQRIGVRPRATASANIGMGGVKKYMF